MDQKGIKCIDEKRVEVKERAWSIEMFRTDTIEQKKEQASDEAIKLKDRADTIGKKVEEAFEMKRSKLTLQQVKA